MTDKELLELAAKAAGIECWWVENDACYGDGMVFNDENDCLQGWNPLTDDGDALRLAVKLGLDTVFHTNCEAPWVEVLLDRSRPSESLCNDPYTATRRAIVRAAAEIGRNMK